MQDCRRDQLRIFLVSMVTDRVFMNCDVCMNNIVICSRSRVQMENLERRGMK